MGRVWQAITLVVLGVPFAAAITLLPNVLWLWSLEITGNRPLLDEAVSVPGVIVLVVAVCVIVPLALRKAGIARTGIAVALLTAAGLAAGVQTLVTDELTTVAWSVGTPVSAVLTALAVAVAHAVTRGRRLLLVVLLLVGLLLVRAVAEAVVSAQVYERTLRATESTYAAYPHDIAVLDDPAWEPVGTQVTEAGHAIAVTYEDESGRRIVLTSAPAESFLGGRPDPLRDGCDSGSTTCEESGGMVLVTSDASATSEADLIRIELAPKFYAQLAAAPIPDPDTGPGSEADRTGDSPTDIPADELLRLADRVRTDEDGDREALARDVMSHHEW